MDSNFMYLVDWGNGYIGGFNRKFEQTFNTPACDLERDLELYGVVETETITPRELDELRGYHKPTFAEYIAQKTLIGGERT